MSGEEYEDLQYGYRFYDGHGCVGPLTRDEVLAKLRDDLAALPVERRRGSDGWFEWTDSDELMREVIP